MLTLTEDFIENFYNGLKLTNYSFLWSLKKGALPEQNSRFFVRKWLPQEQLLKHESVKAVVSHCGWGGILECVEAKKPILCVPEFGDQPANAKRIQELGVGLVLYMSE